LATLTVVLAMIANILKVVFGLGFVIFLHELGHFLAAKWAGVKVERFFLGFDWPFGLKLASFRYGETVYGIGLLPLGGYVKMLGEERGEDGQVTTDPRAFINKSVGARIVVLSAGVAMNILLGLALFTVVQALGVTEQPARLGVVQPGSPAYEAGLREGDEVVSIDGRGDIHYNRLRLKVSLSGPGQVLHFGVRRAGQSDPISIPIAPKRQARADLPQIGVATCESLALVKEMPVDDPPPPGLDGPPPPRDEIAGGTVVEAGPRGGPLVAVADIFALHKVFVEHRNDPVDIRVELPGAKGSSPSRVTATLPRNRMMTLGLRLTPGPVASIQAGSIAEGAGFRKGDRIVRVEGRDDYDPMHLPDDLHERAGKPTKFVVERKAADKAETVELTATPDASLPWTHPVFAAAEPLHLPGLGMAIEVDPRVAAVDENGPAARAGIKPGATLTSITFPPLQAKEKAKTRDEARPLVLAFGKPTEKDAAEASWPRAFAILQGYPRGDLRITLANSSAPVILSPQPDPSWTNPLRGLNFLGLTRDLPPQPIGTAFRRGLDETYDNVVSIYAMIRSLFQGQVSPKNLAGLPRIANIAYQTASLGLVPLLSFLGMLSINLAVLNFMPIPPLDGGQIAFLLAEKVRGKPLPETTLTVLMLGGIAAVVCLMLYTIIQDIILMVF